MADKKPTPKSVAKSIESKTEAPREVEEVVEVPKSEAVEVVDIDTLEKIDGVPVFPVDENAKPLTEAFSIEAPATTYAVVSGGAVDPVHLSKCVFKSTTHKRSLTVHHLQRRLKEWGYMDAYLDKDGYFGDLTLKSVNEFRKAHGIFSEVAMDAETFSAIFEGDTNVSVVLD